MAQYINKAAVVAEIERRIKEFDEIGTYLSPKGTLTNLLCFLDTLEMKEIHEDIDMDLNPFFEELGVEPDSRIAYTFKEAFYKGIDRYLNKKENQVKQINQ